LTTGRLSGPQAHPSRVSAAAPGQPAPQQLFTLRPGAITQAFFAEDFGFWLVCLYLVVEYVRPQQIYKAIEGWPISQWVIIGGLLAQLMRVGSQRKLGIADAGMAMFSAVVLLSTTTAYYPSYSVSQYIVFFNWVVIYYLITNTVVTERKFLLFSLLYLLCCLKMSQHGVRTWASVGFGFRRIGVSCSPGFFRNSGECGIQMVMYFAFSLFFVLVLQRYWGRLKRAFFWFMPASALATVIASSSRGAVLAVAVLVTWMVLANNKRRWRMIVAGVVIATIGWLVLPAEQKARFTTMGEDQTSQSRLTCWRHGLDMIREHPLLGIGYKNWEPYYRTYISTDEELPHNIFIEAGAELGALGLLAFGFLITATFVLNRDTRRLVKPLGADGEFLGTMSRGLDLSLIGYLVAGFFVTVLYYPFFWINLAMTVGLHEAAKARLAAAPAPLRAKALSGRGQAPRTLRTSNANILGARNGFRRPR